MRDCSRPRERLDPDERPGVDYGRQALEESRQKVDMAGIRFESWTVGRLESDVIFKDRFGNSSGSHEQHRPMAAACKAAAIEPAIGMHTLRHTYASSLVQAGVSLAIVAEALGHADMRMVSKHYGHLAPSHVADAIRAHLPALGVELDNTVTRLPP
jgi:site-specific recombinase XerD